jgi:membrane associated rhomboid family serine protease
MILFLSISAIYSGILLFYKPLPDSIKANPLSLSDNFRAIKASLFLGPFFLIIFLFTSDFEFLVINKNLYALLALNNEIEITPYWPIQVITHLFIHSDLYHVAANVSGIGLASVYERRVGSKRFMAVLAVASVTSIPSIVFYPEYTAICGISGGVFGLAAAYFTDHDNLTIKEWFYAILLGTFLMVLFSIEGEFKSNPSEYLQLEVDHIGHLMGFIGAIIYCRLTSKPD